MNKKILYILSILSIVVFLNSCGGGGGGGLSTPPGTNVGIPSVVKLLDVQTIVQTNATLYLKAKILDGTGLPVPNVQVNFTNLSAPFGQLSATIASTDATGVATVTMQSSQPGFAAILAEINTGAGQVRERWMVYFTNLIFELPTIPGPPPPPPPFMTLDVDSVPGNSIFNEFSDFVLFSNSADDSVEVIATVFNADGSLVGPGTSVSWVSDHPEEVEFVRTDTLTDGSGQAQAIILVKPDTLRATDTHVNIGVSAGNDAANLVTLFLRPVTIGSLVVRAAPTIIDSEGTSTITATVTTNLGDPVPDGTAVNFTSTAGVLEKPFTQTSNGVATTTLNAPTVTSDTNITVTAAVGGNSSSTTVLVNGEPEVPETLLVTPASRTVVSSSTAQTTTFSISGGTAPYTTVSANPTIVYNGTVNNGNWTTSGITATIGANAPAGSVVLTVTDADGNTATATVVIQAAAALTVTPSSASISSITGGSVTLAISGGIAPYSAISSSLLDACNSIDADCIDPTDSATWTGSSVKVTVPVGAIGPVTISVFDSVGATIDVTITIL